MKRSLLILPFLAQVLLGDAPLGPKERNLSYSENVRFIAVSDPAAGTSIYEIGRAEILEHYDLWFRKHLISDDGMYLVSEYDGLNLIPKNYYKDLALFTIWKEGEKIKDFVVEDLFPRGEGLEETVSHYYWGSIVGIDEKNTLFVQLAGKGQVQIKLEEIKLNQSSHTTPASAPR